MDLQNYTHSELRAVLDEHIHSARDRRIIAAFYIDRTSYEKIAEAEELTPRQIGYILQRFRKIAPTLH